MLLKAGFLIVVAAVLQVSAEDVPVDYIENVMETEAASIEDGSRIVSGWPALPGQHPHQAALRMVSSVGGVSGCGGSIIARDWVVTAAHCTALRVTVVVRAGVVSLTDPEYIFETTEYYNYPGYNDNIPSIVQPDDIALLKVQRPFVYTRLLQPIRIQSRADMFRNYDTQQLYASGHGLTWTGGSVSEVLNWVYLTGVTNDACRSTFGTIITDNTICARFFNVTSQSTCSGDSGGPLVHVDSDGVPILVGVTSFVAGGSFGCHSGFPAGFIRPGPFLDWFHEITGIDFENLNEDEEEEEQPSVPEEEDDESSSESEEDDEMSQLLKKLEVKVKVNVSLKKYGKVKHEVEKEINKHH